MNEPHILKYFHDHSEDCHKDLKVKAKGPMTEFLQTVRTTLADLKGPYDGLRYQLMHMRDILERWKIAGLNRKLQIKPRSFEEYTDENGETKERCTELQLILKWGGNLTKLGEKQSINLGQRLRHEMVRTDGSVLMMQWLILLGKRRPLLYKVSPSLCVFIFPSIQTIPLIQVEAYYGFIPPFATISRSRLAMKVV
jgi:hypothetical protein